jgi:radical SAM superfamily enzyme YgiQ (UPF0313 family)
VPNGLCAVAGSLDRAGWSVAVLDLCFSRRPEQGLRRALRLSSPDVVAFSVRNIDNSDLVALAHYTPASRTLVEVAREETRVPIVAGGAAFGVAPVALLNSLGVDAAVTGDGELAAPALLAELAAGRSRSPLAGVLWAGESRFGHPEPPADLDALAPAEPWRWTDLRSYQARGATVPVQTKRGCVFRCIYCTYLNVEGRGYRLRSAEAVADEIAELARRGVSRVEFVDSTFNSPPAHAVAVCESLVRRRLAVGLDTTNFTPAISAPELLEAMRRAGFRWLGVTAESGSDRVLARLNKGFDRAGLERCAQRVEAAGMRVLWIFLVGGPGETPATLEETLGFASQRLERGDAVYLTLGLRIYPGTELQRIAAQEGEIDPADPLLAPRFYFSRDLDLRATLDRLRSFGARYPRFMLSSEGANPLLPLLLRTATLLRLPRPHWRYLGLFRRLARLAA